jgi:hypothetical protein
MSTYDPPLQPEPSPYPPSSQSTYQSPYRTAPPPKREFGEGMGGGVIAIAVIGGIVGLVVLVVLFPAFLAWLIALGFLAIVVVVVLMFLFGFLVMIVGAALGLFHLLKRHQVQGPEVGYTLDMVQEPERKSK